MSMDKLPRWSWWMMGTLVLWSGWALVVGRPMTHRVAGLKEQYRKTEAERGALDARMAAVPDYVLRLNRAKYQLDSMLSTFSTDDAIDDLVRQLRASGDQRGLSDVRADPELVSLLHVPMATSTPGTANGRLDTVIVNLSASGAFKSLGHWLDDIEQRTDFRFWTVCHWTSHVDDGVVGLDAQVALVVVNRPDAATDLLSMETPE